MNKKKQIKFLCFFIGIIYLVILIYIEYLGYGLYGSLKYGSLKLAVARGTPINFKSIIFSDVLFPDNFSKLFYVSFLLNSCSLLYIGLSLSKPSISGKIYLSVVFIILILLVMDIFLLSFGAFVLFIFGLPFHVYFFLFFIKNKKALIKT